ncbi:hypothetical protein KC388_05420, partial [Listeria monocytogenes]|uniref:hypothetical protein n=1 Tax=Listeria monocytogenes TaxID=1639 RepID=UPI001F55B1AA
SYLKRPFLSTYQKTSKTSPYPEDFPKQIPPNSPSPNHLQLSVDPRYFSRYSRSTDNKKTATLLSYCFLLIL